MIKKMKQLFLQKGTILVKDVDQPVVGENEILVKVFYSFISTGTESATVSASGQSLIKKTLSNISQSSQKFFGALKDHGFAGTKALIQASTYQYQALGYSCSGQILEVGNKITRLRPGDYVACAGAGFAHHADIIAVPGNLAVKLAGKEWLKQTSITTIGAIALQSVRRARIQLGENVCIIGLGLLGQLTVQLAKQAGAYVFGTDVIPDRLELARQLGCNVPLDASSESFLSDITFATHHHGVDTTIVTAGAHTGALLQQAMLITRRKGKVILVGNVKIDFDRSPFYEKEIDLLISCSYGPGRYDDTYELQGLDYPYPYVRWTENRNMELFVQLIEQQKIKIDPLISHHFDIAQAPHAFNQLMAQQSLGIVLSYGSLETHTKSNLPDKTKELDTFISYKAPNNKVHSAIIGAGGFTKVKLLPIITSLKNVTIDTIIDINQAQALTAAHIYKAKRVGNSLQSVVVDDNIHALVIATPHNLHTQQAIQALKYGKAVFVEKPAAVTMEELTLLKTYLIHNPDSFYCVDFNRSFAPFIEKIRKVTDTRTNPLVVNYRMNAGFLPMKHWSQSPQSGGRIIGEACHIFELFCSLTNSQPRSVAVQCLQPVSDAIPVTDNFTANISMYDGSMCTLSYTSLGHMTMGKEYMEIHVDGKSIKLRDYTHLVGFGLPPSFSENVRAADKGHATLIKNFFDAANTPGSKPPIPIARILKASELTLIVDHLARQGGGYHLFDKD